MTREEEIRDAWYVYIDESDGTTRSAFESGVLWADEHPISGEQIVAMKNEIKFLKRKLIECDKMYQELQNKNPWISVEDRLPQEGQIIVSYITQTISGGGEKSVEHQMQVEKYKGKFACDRMEQHRMGGYIFDYVAKTTHWLPMPTIPLNNQTYTGTTNS